MIRSKSMLVLLVPEIITLNKKCKSWHSVWWYISKSLEVWCVPQTYTANGGKQLSLCLPHTSTRDLAKHIWSGWPMPKTSKNLAAFDAQLHCLSSPGDFMVLASAGTSENVFTARSISFQNKELPLLILVKLAHN